MMSARVDLFYNSYANFADQVLADVRAETYGRDIGQNSWVTADEYDGYIEALGLGSRSRVLEVASGSGGPALYLAQRSGCHVTGVDLNPNGVLTATALAARAGLAARVQFKVGDAEAPLRFADGAFDALLCIDSMNHFPNRGDTLKEWRRVLKPGGRAVFTDPVVITGPVTNDELAQRSSIGLFVFLPAGLNEELIVKAGFRIVSQTDVTENAALISRRWREARRHFRDDLVRIEGKERFEGVQTFLGAVHKLTRERRLSRIAWVVENPVN
jgi:SAM-dependent methyltransferase